MMINLIEWGTVLSERDLGAEIRMSITKHIRSNSKVTVDFTGIRMINSSFADEVFAKLVNDLGLEAVRESLIITNNKPVLKTIINEAIATRMALVV
ncbi:STAS-like domain-containing protein [Paenibacillus sp. SN-8-1]|uniref:STAS-like domain-containing protein n=1 Tax=Paenibacillus sp. SN-8-1 TaxID=3435409 RepID=UPI003D9A5869